MHPSIAIGVDGLPVVSYWDTFAGSLHVAHCGNVTCTAGNTLTLVDPSGASGSATTSLAVGTDGLPVVSYADSIAGDVKIVHCGNVMCSAGNTLTTVDSTEDEPVTSSVAVGADGLPILSYQGVPSGDLKVAHCGNLTCTAGNTLTTVESGGGSPSFSTTSLAIGADGLPVVSYLDVTNDDLKVAHCRTVVSCQ